MSLAWGTARLGCQQPGWDLGWGRQRTGADGAVTADGQRQSQASRMHRARGRGAGLVPDSFFLPELLDMRQNVISCSFHSKVAAKV